jgi:MinD-like ATPase involved in chromosome partitioning or flagellar assembly
MQILLIGAGNVTSRLNLELAEHNHTVVAQMASFTPQHIDLFDFRGLLVIAPEASVSTECLVQAVERGKFLFVIAGVSDGLAAWANGSGVPAMAYPPSQVDINSLLEKIRQAETGSLAAEDQYRRTVLGGDLAARIQSGMVIRKIAVTSPKGGTGKTTLAVNLATAFALSGITTYLVDADGNAGAVQYHLRLRKVSGSTLIGLLRKETARARKVGMPVMTEISSGAQFLNAFTPIEALPTLKVLPGLITDDLGDATLHDAGKVSEIVTGLYEAGVASGGVVIFDVGINPAHPVHRAALQAAEGIAIVIKPEIPDLAETRRWLARMIAAVGDVAGKGAAYEYVGSRVKLCYNMVVGNGFKAAHNLLKEALAQDKIDLALPPNGIIPFVDPQITATAVNSDRVEDILVWRYKRERLEELAAFTEALLGFAAHFVPVVREGAVRAGLMAGTNTKKRRSIFKR